MNRKTGCGNTAGVSLMDNDVKNRLTKWLSGQLKVGKSQRPGMLHLWSRRAQFLDAHVTDLFPETKDRTEQLEQCYAAFLQLAQLLEEVSDQLMAVVSIPLQDSS